MSKYFNNKIESIEWLNEDEVYQAWLKPGWCFEFEKRRDGSINACHVVHEESMVKLMVFFKFHEPIPCPCEECNKLISQEGEG